MKDVAADLSVQSYCFRGFKTLDALLAQIKFLGLQRTELCGVHVDFNTEDTFASTVDACRGAGISISSIGVQRFSGDQVNEEKWFRFCRLAGARLISATFDIAAVGKAIPLAEKLAEQYDIRLGIHNHGGYHWLGNSDILAHTLQHTSPRIGLCLDTAWCLQSGEDPLEWARRFRDRLFGVHIKDFVFDRAGKWSDVIVGTGNLKLNELLRVIHSPGSVEPICTLEYEGDVDNPGPKLRQCVDAIRSALGT